MIKKRLKQFSFIEKKYFLPSGIGFEVGELGFIIAPPASGRSVFTIRPDVHFSTFFESNSGIEPLHRPRFVRREVREMLDYTLFNEEGIPIYEDGSVDYSKLSYIDHLRR